MSFSFGFAGDDIDSDGGSADDLVAKVDKFNINDNPSIIPPKRHILKDLLSALPSQLSYNILEVRNAGKQTNVDQNTATNGTRSSHSTIQVPRRSVFDIRTQLMAEANPEENDNDTLLSGLEHGDLSSGIYEGGFKTWECAVDLASLLVDYPLPLNESNDQRRNLHIIELGAGSAIPSLVLLQQALRIGKDSPVDGEQSLGGLHFTLCDYNEDVLRLATSPNVLLSQHVSTDAEQNGDSDHTDDRELEDIDDNTPSHAIEAFEKKSISFDFISGGWGDDFVRLLTDAAMTTDDNTITETETLLLASETIYSPTSTKIFADVVMKILQRSPKTSKAWVAAKRIYFGVGGGVDDFEHEIRGKGGSIRTILEVRDAGVARVILEVTAAM